jgi:hypothetical protein
LVLLTLVVLILLKLRRRSFVRRGVPRLTDAILRYLHNHQGHPPTIQDVRAVLPSDITLPAETGAWVRDDEVWQAALSQIEDDDRVNVITTMRNGQQVECLMWTAPPNSYQKQHFD